MRREADYDVVVVGGGLTGLALALALARTPHRVAVLEPRPPQPPSEAWDTRIYAFTPGNVQWLSELGAWGAAVRAQPVYEMRIFGDAGGRLDFDALQAGLPQLAHIAENGRLHWSLWQAAQAAGVSLLTGEGAAVGWGEGRHRLILTDGRCLHARLLVAADGAQSWLRRQAGIEVVEEDYGQAGIVANFACERPHRGIAWQWFRRDGVLAWLPLPGQFISMVWSSRNADVPARMGLDPEALAAEVAAAGGHRLGRLRLVTPPAAFPLKRRRARCWARPGLALIGDAAHTVHPLAGQGVNLGLRDARLLAQTLAADADTGDGDRLRAYALRRVEDVLALQAVTGGLKRLFNNDAPALAWLRNRGLDLTDAQGWLKQVLIAHAVR
ncbi:MAG: FAD-dependent oxidoreductase [Thiobacillaceae bacterium]|nr:FAD-dependent oxidoreductase [Thiobacillaceae bacterium]MDW8322918.1 FAD-dependent oxidoreductase [Burkholderiales bacterium]